jgi:hypothetical protein
MYRSVLKWALAVCAGAVFAVQAVGQSSPQTPPVAPDKTAWNHIGELPDGQRIIVSAGSVFPAHCIFRGVTDHSLYCERNNHLHGFDMREIPRNDVAWVRTGAIVLVPDPDRTVYTRSSPQFVAHLHWPLIKRPAPPAESATTQ